MLSKEEILDEFEPNEEYSSYYHEQQILKAMDEYAKQKLEPLIEGLKAIQSACNGKDVIWTMAEKIIQDAK